MSRKVPGPIAVVILDGWGLREQREHNGVALATKPNYDQYISKYPFVQIAASGEAVGLPAGQMGNSEVGHTTIGIGTVLYQDLVRISKDVESGVFAQKPELQHAFSQVKEQHSTLHVMGLLSAGGVHSHEEHLFAVLRAARLAQVENIVVHVILDGRDVSRTSGIDSLRKLQAIMQEVGGCTIASITGRYFAMDRDTNWDRTDKAFKAIFEGESAIQVKPDKILQRIQQEYDQSHFDELIEPMSVEGRSPTTLLNKNDVVIFTNFRKDRAKQICMRILEISKDLNLTLVTMTKYGEEIPSKVLYEPEQVQETLGDLLAKAGLRQYHIAETEKYPHVTYYFNGGKQDPYSGEKDILIPSRKDIKTHDQAPEMKAKEICDAALANLDNTDFLFLNFANPDMVGHTANEPAIITACGVVDHELGRLVEGVLQRNGALIVIADHGNAETMVDPETGLPHTSHTSNPVPCIFIDNSLHYPLRATGGGLKDIAPTVLDLFDLPKPDCMTGTSLFQTA